MSVLCRGLRPWGFRSPFSHYATGATEAGALDTRSHRRSMEPEVGLTAARRRSVLLFGMALLLGVASATLVVAGAQGSAGGLGRQGCSPNWHAVASAGVPDLSDVVALSATDV
jgi:hypothetical protein